MARSYITRRNFLVYTTKILITYYIYCGVEQRQLVWLITRRSQVRVLSPRPSKKTNLNRLVFFLALGTGLVLRLDKLAWRQSQVRRQGSRAKAGFEHEPQAHRAKRDIPVPCHNTYISSSMNSAFFGL
jgi:hypothetical protein